VVKNAINTKSNKKLKQLTNLMEHRTVVLDGIVELELGHSNSADDVTKIAVFRRDQESAVADLSFLRVSRNYSTRPSS
jgi:hypothetical protein